MKKWIVAVLILAAAAAAGYWYSQREGQAAGPRYETIQVTRGDVFEVVSGPGTVRPSATTAVRAALAGTVTSLSVAEGNPLQAGTELFRVDGRPVFALVTDTPFYRVLASGDEGDDVRALQVSLAALGFYSGEVDGDYGGGTQEAVRDFLDDRGRERTARVGPETFQAVGAADLGTPVAASLPVKVGDAVQPGAAVLLARPELAFDVVVDINEVDIPLVRVGQEASVTLDALPGRVFAGTVVEVSTGLVDAGGAGAGAAGGASAGVTGVVTFPVTIRLDDASPDVKAGMSADADIVLRSATDVLAVPSGAVQEREGATIVLVPGDAGDDGTPGEPRPVPVTVGLRSDDLVEVTDGLAEDQTIIVGLDVETLELPSTGIFGRPGDGPGGDGAGDGPGGDGAGDEGEGS